MQSSRRIQFGYCTLDEGQGVLTASDGAEVMLRPKTLQLLLLLLDNAGQVVPRGTILDAVWPGVFVTDDSVTQCIAELRKAMGVSSAGLLQTLARRGYMLKADVVVVSAASVSVPNAPSFLAPDERPAIAVLPFRKDDADREDAYFANGIIEGIVHVLSGLDGVSVISLGSSLAIADMTTDPRVAARELGVRYVLYGGVRRHGGLLRISTELTDAERGMVIQSNRYEEPEADLFVLQDRIAERVIAAVAPRLRAEEVTRALRKTPTNLTSYDLVMQALHAIQRMDQVSMTAARSLLHQAMVADPGSALPYSYTAWWHSLRIAQGWVTSPRESELAGEHAEAALLRDARDGFALALRGFLHGYMDYDFTTARAMLDEAVRVSPSCAMAWSWGGTLRGWMDEGEDAVRWTEKGLRLSPCGAFAFLHEHLLAQACYTAGDFGRAVSYARHSLAASPQHLANWRTMIASLVAAGEIEEARTHARRLLELDPGFSLLRYASRTPLRDPARHIFVERLRQAGLPN